MIERCWNEVDSAILDCLRHDGPMSPRELGRRIGMSESETTSFLTLLIHEGTVRMQLVEADESVSPFPGPGRSLRREAAGAALTAPRRRS
jgi:predicted transcriptional regulator